ncbi:MAG: hypothetical protein PHX80_04680 [Candidatus Nanoarchaeia archaeon]|nr:hypothetical protein [Candidatus Nanoarchaeia archaeon]
METLKEQIENRCKHFTGMMNKECAVGVIYEDVKDKTSKPYKIPCFKKGLMAGNMCALACFPTDEEVEKEVNEIEESGTKQIKAYMAVKNHIKETGEKQGKIKCTSCGGDLHYTQAECNGHIWGKCKCGLAWME